MNDDEDDDEDDVEFEENEEPIDMFRAASMKEKSEHHCLKNDYKDKILSFFCFNFICKTHHSVDDRYLHLSIKALV